MQWPLLLPMSWQSVHSALVGQTGVGAAVGAVGAAVKRDVGAFVAPCSWSGQQCSSRQHGNIHATAEGTKQHVDCASFMHVDVHVCMRA